MKDVREGSDEASDNDALDKEDSGSKLGEEVEEGEQIPAWLRYLPSTNWQPMNEVPAQEHDGKVSKLRRTSRRKSANPFSTEGLLAKARAGRARKAKLSPQSGQTNGGHIRLTSGASRSRVLSKKSASVTEAAALLDMWVIKK